MNNNSFTRNLHQKSFWSIAIILIISLQLAAEPPTRLYTDPGSPKFTVIEEAKLSHEKLLDMEGDFVAGPKFTPNPANKKMDGVAKGTVKQFSINSKDGTIYNPGIARKVFGKVDPNNPKTLIVDTHTIDYTRTITVYIPAGYKEGTEIPLMVTHDGPKKIGSYDKRLVNIMDNLIAQKRVPPMVVVMIANGGGDAQGHQRGKEYDTMSGLFAEYIETHVLPQVEKNYNIKITKDPNGRATMGNSSGASAALIMAWYRNDLYQRVISWSGTFVNQQWPFDPKTPGGAWDFHTKLIPESPVKPIRIWMGVGDRDLLNPNVMRDNMHDWVKANNEMAKVLKAKGYHYQYIFCKDNGHSMGKAKVEYMPHAIEWVWRDYKK
ncbi:MAG: alpha/beta hydrolase-fold protein [Lentisphaeraceae bacterium]|nr:alpha/beta hydrolase-fold protein [Lentisphaeraceae bacterium]